MQFTEPTELTDALRIARDRAVLPATASSAQIAEWGEELKRLAVFLAGTNHAGYLQVIKDTVEKLLQGKFNEATARMILQQKLHELQCDPARGFPGLEDANTPPPEPGSLRDVSSDVRTQLVLRTLMRLMANRGCRQQGMTEGALFTFPAWELIRIYPQNVPRRPSWPDRWRAVGGQFYVGRMIARKDDPVWAKLGDRELFDDAIGTDYPPFAFNSGMGWRQISRDACKQFGIPVDDIKVPEAAKIEAAQLSVKGIDKEFLRGLRKSLDVEIREGVAKLRPEERKLSRSYECRAQDRGQER
jgi:hypothetical protein